MEWEGADSRPCPLVQAHGHFRNNAAKHSLDAKKRGPVIETVLQASFRPAAVPDMADSGDLRARYRSVRALTLALAAPLSDADATLQSMDDASPAKWHLAHVTWFFETFLLCDRLPGYRVYDERFTFLFNSYYEAVGDRLARPARGMLSRPTLDEIRAFRAHVDEAMLRLIERDGAVGSLVELGLAHEQQHQELLLTDIKHALWRNPLAPALWPIASAGAGTVEGGPMAKGGWIEHTGGIAAMGDTGGAFAFDCEGPRHDVLLRPFALAERLVSNRDWLGFITDGGYRAASLWLSDGWDWVRRQAVTAPLYWQSRDEAWHRFSLSGMAPVDLDAPVSHISQFEADAFATWAGARLPTEFEWEALATADPASGHQLDGAGAVDPVAEIAPSLFGNCWQWTRSAYLPYPGFRAAEGAVGEYNGKFMSGQCVLRGSSCATPRGHGRASYRNFFQPDKRWQFTGLRLAKDI